MQKSTLLVSIFLLLLGSSYAQVAINKDGTEPEISAMLELKSTNKGFLPPRMTENEIKNIVNPANGLMVFNTNNNKVYIFISIDNEWKEINYGAETIAEFFPCGDALIDSRDGQSYTTVQIGTQCWMAENLNIGTMIIGDENQTNNGIIEKYCYNNNTSNCDTYGGLYQWYEAMQYITTTGTQGICPTGWHLPTDDEYKTLEMQLGMSSLDANNTGWRGTDEGSKLSGNEPLWMNGNLDQNTNFGTSGFACLPGGLRYTGGSLGLLSKYIYLWTSSESSTYSWSRSLSYYYAQVYRSFNHRTYGLSVRCLRN